jgi:scyllo-inositol 2-dehydrogenase (NADP+)
MTEINVGLIGYGMASRVFHTPFITTMRGLKLTKVFERQSSVSN